MDKLKNSAAPTPALVVKLILVLVFLLTAAFVSGVVIGKNGRRNVDRTSSDEEGINEKLSNCIFNSDELREKYLKLRDAAREKGLLDENDVVNAKVICKPETKPAEKSVEPEPAEKPAEKNVETLPETSPKESSKTEKPAEKTAEKPVEKSPETSPKNQEPVESKSEKTVEKIVEKPKPEEKPDKNKTIDEILTEKKAEQKPVETLPETSPKKDSAKKCLFAIQLAFLDSIEQVNASKKEFKSLKLRVIDGENNGKKWYKIRTGCFDSREAAAAELTKVKSVKKDAFIVSE